MTETTISIKDAGAHGDWCPSRTSNPVLGARTTLGGFDSHTFPPFSILRKYDPAPVPGISVRQCSLPESVSHYIVSIMQNHESIRIDILQYSS